MRHSQSERRASHDDFGAARKALRDGVVVDDRVFDEVYPLEYRRASRMHWTPVPAAVRASRWLADGPNARILDIGSGVGKFCIVAAATTRAHVTGIEHRGHLVDAARAAASRFGVDVAFRHASFEEAEPRDFDGVYLFNPFAESLCRSVHWIDASIDLDERRFEREVTAAQSFLRAARVGTRVVTYCGFGGDIPTGYVQVCRERWAGSLELWIKTRHEA